MAYITIKENLLQNKEYKIYCASDKCDCNNPVATFNGAQFECSCGWHTRFPEKFINEYKIKWNLK